MKENFIWEGKYKFTVRDSKTKDIVREDIVFNRILDTALKEMAKALYDGSNDCIVNYLALGTQTATLLNTLTSLGSETFRTYKANSTVSGTGEVSNTFYVLSNDAKFHIKEVGIFMGSTASSTAETGQLMSIIAWDYDHTSKDEEIQITRYDSFNRSTKDRGASEYVPVESTPTEETVTKDVYFLTPMYIYPTTPTSDWDTMTAYAEIYGNRIRIMANPNNGPGASLNSDYYNAITAFNAAGGQTYGYIYTSYATRSTADVKTDIDNWANWYPTYGFFVDEMANDADTAKYEYYKWIYDYIKSIWSGFEVIGNPGATTLEGYMYYDGGTVSDVLCWYENSTDFTSATNSSWTDGYDDSNFYAICHNCATVTVAQSYIEHAIGTGKSKWIFITDDVLPNPYDTLPSYLSSLLEYCNF